MSIRELIESLDQITNTAINEGSVEADTDRYYNDMDRREQQAQAEAPGRQEDAIQYYLSDPRGQKEFLEHLLDNLTNKPLSEQEYDTELMIAAVQHYFRTVVAGNKLPSELHDSETLQQLVQDRAEYN